MYGWSSDALGFIVEEVSGQTLEEFWSENLVYQAHSHFSFSRSKKHIFGPLGMETTFYLTPELRKRIVNLTYREQNGSLSPWRDQVNIIEQDPTKGIKCLQSIQSAPR